MTLPLHYLFNKITYKVNTMFLFSNRETEFQNNKALVN